MAKYEDYAQTDLDTEIQEAGDAAKDRGDEIPDQFKGKSAAEISSSYVELQSLNSRQANELGDTRKTVAALTQELTSVRSSDVPAEPAPVVTMDELYEDTEGAIQSVVDRRVSAELEGIKAQLANRDARDALSDFEGKYPGYRDKAQSTDMQTWISQSPYRKTIAAKADQGDLQAASELFDIYHDLTGAEQTEPSQDQAAETRSTQLANASLETGATTMHPRVETFSRAELTNYRIMAKRGNSEAQTFLDKNSTAIRGAYEEGRITD